MTLEDFDTLLVRVVGTYHGADEACVQITPPNFSMLNRWQASLVVLPPVTEAVDTDAPIVSNGVATVAIGLGNDSPSALVSLARLVGLDVKEF